MISNIQDSVWNKWTKTAEVFRIQKKLTLETDESLYKDTIIMQDKTITILKWTMTWWNWWSNDSFTLSQTYSLTVSWTAPNLVLWAMFSNIKLYVNGKSAGTRTPWEITTDSNWFANVYLDFWDINISWNATIEIKATIPSKYTTNWNKLSWAVFYVDDINSSTIAGFNNWYYIIEWGNIESRKITFAYADFDFSQNIVKNNFSRHAEDVLIFDWSISTNNNEITSKWVKVTVDDSSFNGKLYLKCYAWDELVWSAWLTNNTLSFYYDKKILRWESLPIKIYWTLNPTTELWLKLAPKVQIIDVLDENGYWYDDWYSSFGYDWVKFLEWNVFVVSEDNPLTFNRVDLFNDWRNDFRNNQWTDILLFEWALSNYNDNINVKEIMVTNSWMYNNDVMNFSLYVNDVFIEEKSIVNWNWIFNTNIILNWDRQTANIKIYGNFTHSPWNYVSLPNIVPVISVNNATIGWANMDESLLPSVNVASYSWYSPNNN